MFTGEVQRAFDHREKKREKEGRRRKRRFFRRRGGEKRDDDDDDDDDDGNNNDRADVCGIRERTVIGGGARGSDEEMFEERQRERERGGASETDRKGSGVYSNGFEEFEAVETEPAGVSVERADDVFAVLG